MRDEAAMREIERTLGAARYQQLRRASDPRYALMNRIGTSRGAPSEKIDRAYAILNETPAGSASKAEQKLDALLGTELTAAIMRAYYGPGQSARGGTSVVGGPTPTFGTQSAFANMPARIPCTAGAQ
jgi:hypothetical protein